MADPLSITAGVLAVGGFALKSSTALHQLIPGLRLVLRGLGVSMALPWLEAMAPRHASAQSAAPLRFACIYSPNGFIMDKWTPTGSGADFTLSPILSPLEPYKKYVSSFGNLENAATAGSVHSFTPSTWLSTVPPGISSSPAAIPATP